MACVLLKTLTTIQQSRLMFEVMRPSVKGTRESVHVNSTNAICKHARYFVLFCSSSYLQQCLSAMI